MVGYGFVLDERVGDSMECCITLHASALFFSDVTLWWQRNARHPLTGKLT